MGKDPSCRAYLHARRLAIGAGRLAVREYGIATARWRPNPEFLIIGAKRGGSTSLYFDLLGHTRICPLFPRPERLPKASATKGIHFFDSNSYRSEAWYRSHLPSEFARSKQASRVGGNVVTGEASPYYLFHPAAAARAHSLLPAAKIIAVLRDPVMRTYSHWKERRRSGGEVLEFVEALAAEDARIGDAEARLTADPRFYSYAHENLSYARQSEYATALARWYAQYPPEQILVLASEDYYRDAQGTLERVLEFLDLPYEPIASGQALNAAAGGEIESKIRADLVARFSPLNAQLAELTGQTFPWP